MRLLPLMVLLLPCGLARRSCKAPHAAPPPSPLPPLRPHGHNPSHYASHVPLGDGVTLHANVHSALQTAELLVEAAVPPGKSIAWLGLGLSPNGQMSGGSFMIGWGSSSPQHEGCVKATSLAVGATEGPPNGEAGFALVDAESAWAVYDGAAWLQLKRPLHDHLAGHTSIGGGTLHVLYAAGSTAPSSCDAPLEAAHYHDVIHGAKAINLRELTAPQPAPMLRSSKKGILSPRKEAIDAPAQRPQFLREDVVSLGSADHPLGYTVITEQLFSKAFYLRNGDIAFTAFGDTRLPMPTGDYAVLELVGGLVDCNNESVPLDKVYNHHWLMKPISGPTTHFNKPCPNGQDFSYVFGVGAESRRTPTVIPDGFGYHVASGTIWGANIHLLHTEGLAGGEQGVKECIECWGGPGKACGKDHNGSFACCQSGRCAVADASDDLPTEYKMRLTIKYTRELEKVQPVGIETYLAPGCQYEYNVHANSKHPEQRATKTWTIDEDKRFLFGVGHMHSGALNVSVFVNEKFVCASYPVYGKTPGKAVDELGHLVQATRCVDDGSAGGYPDHPSGSYRDQPVVVKAGDKLRVDGWYYVGDHDARILPTPAGAHLGVMSYFYAVFAKGTAGLPPTAPQQTSTAERVLLGLGGVAVACAAGAGFLHVRKQRRRAAGGGQAGDAQAPLLAAQAAAPGEAETVP